MTPSARPHVGYGLVVVAAIGWGTWPLILHHAPMPPSLQALVLMAVQTLVSLLFLAKDRVRVRATRADWALVAWLGVGDAMNVVLFFAAYQRTTVAVAVLTHYLTPIFVALAAPWILGERHRVRTYLAVAIAFFGLVLLLSPWRAGLAAGDAVGAALGAGSAVFYASNVLVTKRLSGRFSASELAFFHGLVALPLLALFITPSEAMAVPYRSLSLLLLGALFPGALGGLLFVWGLRRVPAGHASTLTLLEPTVAVGLAALFLGQRPGPTALVGGILVLAGASAVVLAGRDA